MLQLYLELDIPVWWHSQQFIGKYIWIFLDYVYLLLTLPNNGVNRCLETSNYRYVQSDPAIHRRV
jgi:hypothetical protein